MNATRALFESLIDYAGLFPPAQLEMQSAVEEYGVLRGAQRAWMLGRFIVPASRIFELCEALEALADGAPVEPYPASVIVDAGSDARAWLANAAGSLATLAKMRGEGQPVKTQVLEVPAPVLLAARDTYDSVIGQFGMLAQNAGLRDMPVYVELPRTNSWEQLVPGAMAALGRANFGAKLRCGSATADAFPSCEQVALFVRAAYENNAPFKATAGLHHAVRQLDPQTGFFMHGFLNVLAASVFVRAGAADAELVKMLEEEDKTAFGLRSDEFFWRDRTASTAQIQQARVAGFVSYGSCSFEEPVQDLEMLALLTAAAAA